MSNFLEFSISSSSTRKHSKDNRVFTVEVEARCIAVYTVRPQTYCITHRLCIYNLFLVCTSRHYPPPTKPNDLTNHSNLIPRSARKGLLTLLYNTRTWTHNTRKVPEKGRMARGGGGWEGESAALACKLGRLPAAKG